MIQRRIADPIETDAGLVAGSMEGDTENPVRVYKGVPYAAPPMRDLRWKPPQPVEPWDGVRQCTEFSLWPPQGIDFGGILDYSEASEDCLYLNVLTPAKTTADRLPVMVWFHGGVLSLQSANRPEYNTLHLPQHGVVLVTVNQRLGPLGYMAHPLLSEENGASGNYGTMDLIGALQWIQRNITAFGGDADNVTVFGESGGGSKIISLLVSPEAKGLLHKAIIESGDYIITPDGQQTLAQGEAMGVTLMDVLVSDGKLPSSYTLEDMRALSWIDIIEAADEAIEASDDAIYYSYLTVDGRILPDSVYNIFQAGKQHDVPLIIGCNKWENTSFERMTIAAEAWSNLESGCYLYVFTHMPSNWSNVYAPHAIELGYVFGILDSMALMYYAFDMFKNIFHDPLDDPRWVKPSTPDPGIDESDEYVCEAMASMWTHFAATGDPSAPGLATWPAYDPSNPQFMEIADPLEVKPWTTQEDVFDYGPMP